MRPSASSPRRRRARLAQTFLDCRPFQSLGFLPPDRHRESLAPSEKRRRPTPDAAPRFVPAKEVLVGRQIAKSQRRQLRGNSYRREKDGLKTRGKIGSP